MLNRDTLELALIMAVQANKLEVAESFLKKGAKGTALINGNNQLENLI